MPVASVLPVQAKVVPKRLGIKRKEVMQLEFDLAPYQIQVSQSTT